MYVDRNRSRIDDLPNNRSHSQFIRSQSSPADGELQIGVGQSRRGPFEGGVPAEVDPAALEKIEFSARHDPPLRIEAEVLQSQGRHVQVDLFSNLTAKQKGRWTGPLARVSGERE